ncbi:hypothetical protein ACRTDJ_11215 [Shewanella algae]
MQKVVLGGAAIGGDNNLVSGGFFISNEKDPTHVGSLEGGNQ